MKFNSITTETKFKYLSKRALGTAKIEDVATFTPEFHKSSQDWFPNVQLFTNLQINKAKCIDLSVHQTYTDSDGNKGVIKLDITDDVFDGSNIIFGWGAFACYNLPDRGPRIVKNLTCKNGNHSSWAFFGNSKIQEIYGMKVIGNRYGMFEGASNLRIVKGLDLSETTTNQQMFNSFHNYGPLTVLEFTGCKLSIDISPCVSLPREQLVKIFKEGLEPVTTTQTITLGSTLLAKLTDEDKKIATDKGWTLA